MKFPRTQAALTEYDKLEAQEPDTDRDDVTTAWRQWDRYMSEAHDEVVAAFLAETGWDCDDFERIRAHLKRWN